MSKEDTKNHILDTAIELFWAKSYHGVNMNALSRAADVNKATLYQYFASKEVLAVAAVKRAAERTEDYVYRTTFDEISGAKERLEAIYAKVFDMHDALFQSDGKCRGCPFVNLGVELSTSSEPIRLAVNNAFASFEPYYDEIVGDLNKAGDVEKDELVASLLANMNSCQVASKFENSPTAIWAGQKRALQMLGL